MLCVVLGELEEVDDSLPIVVELDDARLVLEFVIMLSFVVIIELEELEGVEEDTALVELVEVRGVELL